MSRSRENILSKLRSAQGTISPHHVVEAHIPMVPLGDTSQEALIERFMQQVEKLACVIYAVDSQEQALSTLLGLIGSDRSILSWSLDAIPLAGLADALAANGIEVASSRDASVRIGLTGVDAALAATGSLVLSAAPEKHRVTSLLPPIHIAIVRRNQILADLETWVARQREQGIDRFRALSSTMIISGPSRTADIAMELVMGMHGPREVHIVLVNS